MTQGAVCSDCGEPANFNRSTMSIGSHTETHVVSLCCRAPRRFEK